MIEKYLSPGDKVELKSRLRIDAKEGEKSKVYVSKVNQVLEEDRLEILMPMEQQKLVLLPRNARFSMTVYNSKGMYQCEVKIADRYKSGTIFCQVLELLTGIKKTQRREYYRYSCTLPVFCRKLMEDEKETLIWDESIKGREGYSLDIGGGGIRFIMEENFQADELVICHIPLEIRNSVREIQGIGKVLSSKLVKDSTKLYEVRVQFEIMSSATREDIIQYIFEDERRKRRSNNGMGIRG